MTLISSGTVVKFGAAVTQHEANNQEMAYQLLKSHKFVRAPRPLGFLQADGVGYLAMEYVEGPVVDQPDPDMAPQIFQIIQAFAEIQHAVPGPLGGGFCRGSLWFDYHDFHPSDIHDIESYYNRRVDHRQKLTLYNYPPRTFPWGLGCEEHHPQWEIFHVLDWATAGFYPKLFEICAMRINTPDRLIPDVLRLITEIGWLNESEEFQTGLILQAAHTSMRFIQWVPHTHKIFTPILTPFQRSQKLAPCEASGLPKAD